MKAGDRVALQILGLFSPAATRRIHSHRPVCANDTRTCQLPLSRTTGVLGIWRRTPQINGGVIEHLLPAIPSAIDTAAGIGVVEDSEVRPPAISRKTAARSDNGPAGMAVGDSDTYTIARVSDAACSGEKPSALSAARPVALRERYRLLQEVAPRALTRFALELGQSRQLDTARISIV